MTKQEILNLWENGLFSIAADDCYMQKEHFGQGLLASLASRQVPQEVASHLIDYFLASLWDSLCEASKHMDGQLASIVSDQAVAAIVDMTLSTLGVSTPYGSLVAPFSGPPPPERVRYHPGDPSDSNGILLFYGPYDSKGKCHLRCTRYVYSTVDMAAISDLKDQTGEDSTGVLLQVDEKSFTDAVKASLQQDPRYPLLSYNAMKMHGHVLPESGWSSNGKQEQTQPQFIKSEPGTEDQARTSYQSSYYPVKEEADTKQW